jgi:hypothetical protein
MGMVINLAKTLACAPVGSTKTTFVCWGLFVNGIFNPSFFCEILEYQKTQSKDNKCHGPEFGGNSENKREDEKKRCERDGKISIKGIFRKKPEGQETHAHDPKKKRPKRRKDVPGCEI